MIVSCEASSKFHRTSFQNERFARCFRQFSQKKLPKGSFRARLPPNFTEQASKTSVLRDASSKFHRTSFQNERFARCFRQFSQKKLPKGSFRARLPPNFIEQCFQNERFARCFRQFSPKICVSLQFRAIDTPIPARGFIRQKQNVPRTTAACHPKFQNVRFTTAACAKMYESIDREPTRFAHTKMWGFTTVLDDRHHVFTERVHREQKKNYVSLQFWAIDTTFLPRGLTARKWNLRFATVLGDRHHVFSERVEFHVHTRAIQLYSINNFAKKLKEKLGFYIHYHSRRVAMVWNDMQWYSYSLPFLLMQTFWMDRHWRDPYWWDTCWRYVLVGYVLVGYVCDSCWCTPFEWIRIEWIRITWIRIGGIRVERIRIGGIRIGGIRIAKPADAHVLNGYALHGYVLVGYALNGYVLVGYVLVGYLLNGYVWDMCGVMDMCGICVVWDMCGICVVWDTPTIFWRTLRRNVFREKGLTFHEILLPSTRVGRTSTPVDLLNVATGFVSKTTMSNWEISYESILLSPKTRHRHSSFACQWTGSSRFQLQILLANDAQKFQRRTMHQSSAYQQMRGKDRPSQRSVG